MSISIDQEKVLHAARLLGINSISQLAKFSKIDRNTLTAYLKSEKSPLSQAILKLAAVLDLSPADFLKLDGQNSSPESRVSAVISKIISKDPNLTVILFGSRSSKTAKTWSDVDLGLTKGLTQLSDQEFLCLYGKIKDACDDLPWNVDVVNLDAAPTWFLQGIKSKPKLLLGSEKNYTYFLGKLDGVRLDGDEINES